MTIRHLYPAVEPSLNLDFANSKKLDPRITFTRASTGTYLDPETQLIKTAAANEARIEKEGLLIEESRTNIWLNSDDPTQKSVANVSCTLDSSVLDPLGNSSGKIEVTAVNTYQLWRQTGFSLTSGSYTFSVYLKAGTISSVNLSSGNSPNAVFDIANGAVTSETGCTAKIQSAANGWFRCSITWTATNTTEIRTWTVSQAVGTYYFVAAAQVEASPYPTSYIPTSGSTVTRAADAASITGTNFSSWYNSSAGTVFTKFKSQYPDGEPTTIFEGQAGSTIRTFAFTNYNRVQFQYGSTSVYSNDGASGYPTESDFSSAALFYTDDGTNSSFGGSYQGFPVVSGTGTGGVTISSLIFAPFTGASGALQASSAHLSRFTYYPYRLTNAQLEALTL